MTLQTLVAEARARLERAGIASREASLDAELLARYVLGWDRPAWFARRSEDPPAGFADRYAGVIDRRATREPVAYIRGVQEFWDREFRVSPDVLIPRPETELIVEEVERLYTGLDVSRTIADIGTGSGCLAITLALELPEASIVATDVSEKALRVARENAARLGAADRIRFLHGRGLAGACGPFDLIVSNPPYVTDAEYDTLQPEIRAHEPALALRAGPDGLEGVKEVLRDAEATLALDGWLLMEIGGGQRADVERLVADTARLLLLRVREDPQGLPRVAVMTAAK